MNNFGLQLLISLPSRLLAFSLMGMLGLGML
ncbi:hypothetical protein BJ987_000488 [Nocardia goodfellowii]|uniref:Uncharacterized protein n=1 Tax=Nocardia goodfellowii TaxID=882446 RepID=A0ABS4Q7F5_9NOCA|nr:hypothetical protein [Nocardia goodfellowii]